MDEILRIEGLSKKYKGTNFWAVDNLSFTVQKGTVCALLGHNGAGKSTTLKSIVNHIIPQKGEIYICGDKNTLEKTKKRIGYLPETPFLPSYYTVNEIFEIGRLIWGIEKQRIEKLIEYFELERYRNIIVEKLSKGNRQKLAIAFTCIHNPEIYIWDEPTDGLDPVLRKKISDFIRERKNSGRTFLISSHILTEVENLYDKYIILKEGELSSEGDREKLQKSGKSLEDIYIENYTVNENSIF
ncbi:MAG: ATP-binding cassette domain-containing protein [Proteobacteria bacterium]|nr:ATP-binding cassette domain-containing protein [Pseudomonadota bacterium]